MPTSITIIFLLSVVSGIVLIIFSLVSNRNTQKEQESTKFDMIAEKQNSLLKAIEDADDAIEQINSISKHVFEEQEEKYQELLYLYQIIDEKKKELVEIWGKTTSLEVSKSATSEVLVNTNLNDKKKTMDSFVINNPNYNEIMNLYNSGMNITQIAKQLSIGQGEVSLIIKLKERSE